MGKFGQKRMYDSQQPGQGSQQNKFQRNNGTVLGKRNHDEMKCDLDQLIRNERNRDRFNQDHNSLPYKKRDDHYNNQYGGNPQRYEKFRPQPPQELNFEEP